MTIFFVEEPFWGDGIWHMERDKLLLKMAAMLDRDSCFLRMYGWSAPTISLGKNQRIENLNHVKLELDAVHFVQRITGGGCVWHDKDQITYSVAAPVESILFGETLESSCDKIGDCLIDFAQRFQNKTACEKKIKSRRQNFSQQPYACFSSTGLYEILVQQKKWIGSAQKRTNRAFIQHGSILLRSTQQKILKYMQDEQCVDQENRVEEIGLWDFAPQLLMESLQSDFAGKERPQKILEWMQDSFQKVLKKDVNLYHLA